MWLKGHFMIWTPATTHPQFWNSRFAAHILLSQTLTFRSLQCYFLCLQYSPSSLPSKLAIIWQVSVYITASGNQDFVWWPSSVPPLHLALATLSQYFPHCKKTGKQLNCVLNPRSLHAAWHRAGTSIIVEGRKERREIQFICCFMTLNSTLYSLLTLTNASCWSQWEPEECGT